MLLQQSARPRPELRVAPGRERVVEGGVVTWACMPGFPPAVIFPFTPPERFGTRNVCEMQALLYRPLYWLGNLGVHVMTQFLLRKKTRAATFRPSTPSVIRNTPAHAMRCRFGYAEFAKLKMTTGMLAIGLARFELKNWFDSAV